MALNKATLKAAIQSCFEDVREDKTPADAAQQLADAIDAYVRSATVSTTVTGVDGTGSPVTGTGTGGLS